MLRSRPSASTGRRGRSANVAAVELPSLDHVSFRAAPGVFDGLGFEVTPTRGANAHGRVFLDRHYLEVDETGDSDARSTAWFLGAEDLDRAAAMLAADVVPTLWPARHEGHDGVWSDVVTVGHSSDLPILCRRLDLDAKDWPPAL